MGLFDAETDPAPTIAFFQQIFGEDVGYKVEQLEDKDWVREWMDHFHPMQFGERLWICPSWRDVPNPDAVNVMLDPGLAFGTGTHPQRSACSGWTGWIWPAKPWSTLVAAPASSASPP
jgi:ribosomal protein L11 methyltransferase